MGSGDSEKNWMIADRYEIRGYLGSGGFGEVFLAYDRQVPRQGAIKRFKGSNVDSDVKRHYERELCIHSQLTGRYALLLHDSLLYTEEGNGQDGGRGSPAAIAIR
jgi:serine/threonine protein kinase